MDHARRDQEDVDLVTTIDKYVCTAAMFYDSALHRLHLLASLDRGGVDNIDEQRRLQHDASVDDLVWLSNSVDAIAEDACVAAAAAETGTRASRRGPQLPLTAVPPPPVTALSGACPSTQTLLDIVHGRSIRTTTEDICTLVCDVQTTIRKMRRKLVIASNLCVVTNNHADSTKRARETDDCQMDDACELRPKFVRVDRGCIQWSKEKEE